MNTRIVSRTSNNEPSLEEHTMMKKNISYEWMAVHGYPLLISVVSYLLTDVTNILHG